MGPAPTDVLASRIPPREKPFDQDLCHPYELCATGRQDAGSPPAVLMKDPQLPFAVMATRILSDLHAAGYSTRVVPRWRRF